MTQRDTDGRSRSRRDVIRLGGGATALTLAGCTSMLDPDDEDPEEATNGDDETDDPEADEPITVFEAEFDPVAFFLTWTGDPTTTMSINWQTEEPISEDPRVEYREVGTPGWTLETGETAYDATTEFHPDPETNYDRHVHRAELSGLDPDTQYEFRFGTAPVWSFETLPASLDEPLTFANGGDSHYEGWNPILEAMGEHDPAFLTICGDMPYSDGGTADDSTERWHSWFDSVKEYLVDEDGQVTPIVVGIGNHECRTMFFNLMGLASHVPADDVEFETDDEGAIKGWVDPDNPELIRERFAPYFYTFFPFPGQPGYGVFDVGEYLSIPMTDTYHTNPIYGEQLEWLDSVLEDRRSVPHVLPHLHAPFFPSHRDEDETYTRQMQEAWLPLFEREGLPLTFGHHDHTTKLTPPLLNGEIDEDGIVEVGDGCLGMPPRAVRPEREWIEHATAKNCVNIVTIDGEETAVETIGHDNETLQEITREVREV